MNSHHPPACPSCQSTRVVETTRWYAHTAVDGFTVDATGKRVGVAWGDIDHAEDDHYEPEYVCRACGYEASDVWEFFLATYGVVTPGSTGDDPAVVP